MAVSTEVITSPLQQMAATTATDYWNDSSSVEELDLRGRARRDRGDEQPDDRRRGARRRSCTSGAIASTSSIAGNPPGPRTRSRGS